MSPGCRGAAAGKTGPSMGITGACYGVVVDVWAAVGVGRGGARGEHLERDADRLLEGDPVVDEPRAVLRPVPGLGRPPHGEIVEAGAGGHRGLELDGGDFLAVDVVADGGVVRAAARARAAGQPEVLPGQPCSGVS